jgi:transcriptional repressor NrdR
MSLRCPRCGAFTRIEGKKAEVVADGRELRRKRVCEGREQHRFDTYERAQTGLIRKESGSLEDFDRGKLERGLRVAVNKRPVDQAVVTRFIDDISNEVKEHGTLESHYVGDRCLAFLREHDDVAYIRFLSVYREFGSLTQFRDEIARLDSSLSVQKSKGRIEPFDRAKLLRGLTRAVNRRNIPYERLEEIVAGIVDSASPSGVISSAEIGDGALRALRELDVVAYIRFASVYRDFDSVEDFLTAFTELKSIPGERDG